MATIPMNTTRKLINGVDEELMTISIMRIVSPTMRKTINKAACFFLSAASRRASIWFSSGSSC